MQLPQESRDLDLAPLSTDRIWRTWLCHRSVVTATLRGIRSLRAGERDEVESDAALAFATSAPRQLRSIQSPAAWIRRITVNAARGFLRRQGRTRTRESENADECVDRSLRSPMERASCNELDARLTAELDVLSERLREVAGLRLLDGHSFRDIALECGVSEDAARKRFQQARLQLAARLRANDSAGKTSRANARATHTPRMESHATPAANG